MKLYTVYEASGKARRVLKARELWQAVIDSQTETGNPYILYKVSSFSPRCCLAAAPLVQLSYSSS